MSSLYTQAPGTRLADIVPRPKWLDFKLGDKGFSVGDLVTYTNSGYTNHLTIYRIVKDCPPQQDSVVAEVNHPRSLGHYKSKVWVKPGTKTKVPHIRLYGCVEIIPAFNFFPRYKEAKKTVAYSALYRLTKVDILELARSFSRFQDFITEESKRLSE